MNFSFNTEMNFIHVGFEVFTAVVMKSIIFWDMTLKMEAIRSSETSGATQWTTQRHIPEDDTLYNFLHVGIIFCLT
jgi:hypothetical protein